MRWLMRLLSLGRRGPELVKTEHVKMVGDNHLVVWTYRLPSGKVFTERRLCSI